MVVALAVLAGGAMLLRREIATLVRDALRPAPAETPRLKTKIVQLRAARAKDVAGAIAGAPGEPAEFGAPSRTLVVAHEGTNSLIVQAHPEEYARILEMIADLDAPR